MVTEAEARDPNSVPSQPRYSHRGGSRRRRHQGENIFKPCGQQFRLFFPAQKCFENRCRALRTSSTTTALGAIWGILLGRTSSSWRSTRRASGPTRQRYQLLSPFLVTPFTKTIPQTFMTFNHRCHPFIKTIIPSLEFITSLSTFTASLTSRP